MKKNIRGTSIIDLVLSMAIVALLFGGVYLVYFSIITAVATVSVRSAATTAIGNEIEMIRDLPYTSVGTVNGIPSGVIPQSQTVSVGNYLFSLKTTVLNIVDPFNQSPIGQDQGDYKLISVEASCPLCNNPVVVKITTTVAPPNLNAGTQNGSLFIYALNADGVGIQDAEVTVMNASVTPAIDLTDTTNASGVLELVGAPTSSQGYFVSVTKPGYSADQTYPIGGAGNPNPVTPYATVAAQTVTALSFSIDQLSTLAVSATDDRCNVIPSESFSIKGTKLIGTSPNVLKFSTTTTMGSGGTDLMQNLEWDTYTLSLNDASYDLMGTIPLDPITINPNSTQNFGFILTPATNPSLLATVTDAATGAGIEGATVNITKSGSSETQTTGEATVSQTNWSGGQYTNQSGMDTSATGLLQMLANASGTYATSTTASLISNTINLGGSSSTLYSMSWTPTSEPSSTGAGSISFQVATNNDNATWNFVGPDGTGSSYFTVTPSTLPALLSGNRYLRYEVFMNTQDPSTSPSLTGVTFGFSANCVPPAQTLFTGLAQGTYTVNVSALDYNNNSTTVAVGGGFQSSTIMLVHQ